MPTAMAAKMATTTTTTTAAAAEVDPPPTPHKILNAQTEMSAPPGQQSFHKGDPPGGIMFLKLNYYL